MSQGDVLAFLEKHASEEFSSRELSEKIGLSIGGLNNNLKCLLRQELVCFKIKFKIVNYGRNKRIRYYAWSLK